MNTCTFKHVVSKSNTSISPQHRIQIIMFPSSEKKNKIPDSSICRVSGELPVWTCLV